MATTNDLQLPQQMGWLADAPLFIDQSQVAAFYDAVVRPPGKATQFKYKVTTELAAELGAKLGISAEASPGAIIAKLAGLFPSLKAKVEVGGEASASVNKKNEDEILIEAIDTPQRQLVQLVVHFLLNYTQRLFFVTNLATDLDWQVRDTICQVPRELVFIDFPGIKESEAQKLGPTRLVPMALELEGEGVKTMFDLIKAKNGDSPPQFPGDGTDDAARDARKGYWKWFAVNFNSIAAMKLVEQVSGKSKIRWIDFRVPSNNEGDTIHLHISPAGKFDTGVFAYNLIQRGFIHGLRIVGTVKCDPDINVLAIYEK